MEELWQQTSEMLWQRPLLWLPVLIADLLGFLVNLGNQALLRADIYHNLQYRSALGGAALKGPVSANAVEHVTLVALLLGWASNFLHLLVYTVALVVTAHLVARFFAQRRRSETQSVLLPPVNIGAVLGFVLQAWVIYVVFSFAFGWLTRSLVTHGHRAVLSGGWLELGAGVLFVGVLAFLLAPTTLQMLTRQRTTHLWNSRAQLFAFLVGVVAVLLARYIAANMHSVHIAQPFARYALELTGSWIAALPYAVMFTGLSLMALRSAREQEAQQSVTE